MLKTDFSNEVYNKFLSKYFHLKSDYCDGKITDLFISLDSLGYRALCRGKSIPLDSTFVEAREPEVINNIYNINKVDTIVGSRIDISVSTSSTTKPLVPGLSTYQHDSLKGQNPPVIFVNNVPEFSISNQFTINPTTGTLTRSQAWVSGDTLVII